MSVAAQKKMIEPEAQGCFLGVTQSARGFRWVERLPQSGAMTAVAISQRHGLSEMLGRVLAARGATLETVESFLDPTIRDMMPDPDVLQDMGKAADRLADAVTSGQKVAIFGDYDVDGACSSALLARFFAAHGITSRIYIPDRIFEGYGPNPDAINTLIDEGADLIVTVDCGSTSHDALGVARPRKTDVVVIDHHQADAVLPDVHAVVNPNRQDDLSGLGHLCAAGVVFVTMIATMRALRVRGYYKSNGAEPKLLDWLDLVALATVCDVVPLTGLNRAFVTKGLQVMHMRRNAGLRALADAAGLTAPANTYHLGFVLGPRINAGGRIGDAALGARLLSIDDAAETGRIAALLDKLNRERKEMETAMLEAALAAAELEIADNPDLPIVIAGSPDWHKGLVGLVASRLTERFRRPSLVISWTDKTSGTGSLRSIAGIDIGTAVREAAAVGLLVKGGGHAMAAGLTVTAEQFEPLKAYLYQRLGNRVGAARDATGLEFDAALTPAGVSAEMLAVLEQAGPFGQGNPQPRFAFPAHRLRFTKIMAEAHVRCVIEAGDGSRIDGIAFRAVGGPVGDLLLNASGMPLHVAGNLRRDSWGGREKIELMIEDVADPRKQ